MNCGSPTCFECRPRTLGPVDDLRRSAGGSGLPRGSTADHVLARRNRMPPTRIELVHAVYETSCAPLTVRRRSSVLRAQSTPYANPGQLVPTHRVVLSK